MDASLTANDNPTGQFLEEVNENLTVGNQIIGGVLQQGFVGMLHHFKVWHGELNSSHLATIVLTVGCTGTCAGS